VCPKCNSDKYTYMLDLNDPNKDDTPLIFGKGGCGQR